ncbi:hypothetical protein CL635_00810 [bacterium]|jgi:hypothetical protein|nr:hypothetical protein [bacterium]|tara:strand:+ start:12472 stop:12834 length:363 start_codon:yes stop_codon:yes gene_type:complete
MELTVQGEAIHVKLSEEEMNFNPDDESVPIPLVDSVREQASALANEVDGVQPDRLVIDVADVPIVKEPGIATLLLLHTNPSLVIELKNISDATRDKLSTMKFLGNFFFDHAVEEAAREEA